MHHERPHPAPSLLLDGHDALERLLVDPARTAELTSLLTLARDLDVRAEDLGGAIEDLAAFDAERWAETSQHPTGTAAFRAHAHQQARRIQQAGLPAQLAFYLYRMGNREAQQQVAMSARRLPLKAAIPMLQAIADERPDHPDLEIWVPDAHSPEGWTRAVGIGVVTDDDPSLGNPHRHLGLFTS